MYEKIEFCPICNTSIFNNYMVVKDHSITGESFALSKCTKCEFVITNPRPKYGEIGKYYESDTYISHSNNSSSIIDKIYKVVRIWTTHQKIRIIKKYKKKGSHLDFGCGTGYFLNTINNSGFDSIGFEPNMKARQYVEMKYKIPVKSNLNEIDNNNKFDIITCWHVIEHVHELNQTVKLLKNVLSNKGVLFIAVPNYKSYDAKYYREGWAGYDVPRHLYHFSQKTMAEFARKHQLKIINRIAMPFDAYYVSLISEKYKNENSSFVNGLKIGFRSNQEAKKTKEYSSIIYILTK